MTPPRLFLAASLVVLASPLSAQCTTSFVPGDGMPGTTGPVRATVLWDPDGAGPQGPCLVVGGAFAVAGTAVARGVARQDLATGAWSAIGAGLEGEVVALAVTGNGTLLAAANANGSSAGNRLAAWNGSAWVQLGGAFDQVLHSVLPLASGDVWVGGAFAMVGAVPAARLARWDGLTWSPVGSGTNGPVRTMLTMPNGDVVIGGTFGTVDGQPANCVARWDGVGWSAFGTGISPAGIDGPYALAVLPGGDLVAAGFFPNAGGGPVGNIARWNGTAWQPLGSGLNNNPFFTGSARAAVVLANGDLVVGGVFTTAGGATARSIARWNGVSWSPIGPGFQQVASFTPAMVSALVQLPNGDVVAGGDMRSGGGAIGENLSRWDGGAWRSLAGGFNGPILAIAEGVDGDVVVGGSFTVAAGASANRVARWNGTAWTPLGSGANNTVTAVAVLPNGDVVIGGFFTSVGGIAAARVARWNGSSWSAMGSGMDGGVVALQVLANGDLIAGGSFTTAGSANAARLARWNGTAWSELAGGVTGSNATITAMHLRPDGSLVVGGSFNAAGGMPATNAATWNGASWSALGSAPFMPHAFTTALGGTLLACDSSYVSQWAGGAWTQIGLGVSNLLGIAGLPDGDLIAVGGFDVIAPPFVFTLGVARWNGTGWSAVDGGLGDGLARVVCVLRNGDVAIGGEFKMTGGEASPWFARLRSACPAGVASLGSGCASSGGGNVLVAQQRAWIGGSFRGRSSGLPSLALVVAATGFTTTSLPLAAVLPAAPGCVLHVSPDVLDVVLASGGAAEIAIAIPGTPALVGASFHHQHVPLEFDAGGALLAASATNALTLTLGSW